MSADEWEREALTEIASFPISGYHAGAAQRIAREALHHNKRRLQMAEQTQVPDRRIGDITALVEVEILTKEEARRYIDVILKAETGIDLDPAASETASA